MRRGPLTVPLVLLVMLLGACATRGSGSPSGTGSPTTVPTTAPATPAPATPAALPGPVTVVRAGGIAGLEDTVVVRPDGSWRRTARAGRGDGTGRLPAGELAKLRALVADPRLAAEAGRPLDLGSCADAFSYSVEVGPTTVRYGECRPGPGQPVAAPAIVRLVLAATGR